MLTGTLGRYEEWSSKLVADPNMNFFSKSVGRNRPGQLDRAETLLHGPANKKALKYKALKKAPESLFLAGTTPLHSAPLHSALSTLRLCAVWARRSCVCNHEWEWALAFAEPFVDALDVAKDKMREDPAQTKPGRFRTRTHIQQPPQTLRQIQPVAEAEKSGPKW